MSTSAAAVLGAGLSLDPFSDLRQLTAYPFMVNALEAGTLVAVSAGVIGWFMVLRRQAFAGHTMSLMSFPGAGAALLLGLSTALGYFVFSVLAAVAIGLSGRGGVDARGQESAVTGTVQALGLGLGFLFLSLYGGVLSDYETLLFGSFLGITRGQVLALAFVAAGTLLASAAAGRPLLFASLDEGVARARGVPVRALSVGFLAVLGLAVAATAQITGALLVFALLVAPAATAQLITPRVGLGLLITVVLGVLTVWIGLALAYFYDYPVGFYVTTVALVPYVVVRAVRSLAGARVRVGVRGEAAG